MPASTTGFRSLAPERVTFDGWRGLPDNCAAAAGGGPGSPGICGRLAGKDWTYIPTTRRVVALTFDAGANADAVPSILATLRREGVPATFFLTGNFVRDFPAAARSIAAAGVRIGDHTITHPYLTQLSDTAVQHEITGGAQQIISVTGQNPAPLFRFPYGDADARTIAIVAVSTPFGPTFSGGEGGAISE